MITQNKYTTVTLSIKSGEQPIKNFSAAFVRGVIPLGSSGIVCLFESEDGALVKNCSFFVLPVNPKGDILPVNTKVVGYPVQVGNKWYIVVSDCFN